MKNNKDNRGLTLIELIAGIAIMGIITAALSVGVFTITNQRVNNACHSIKEAIQLGQTYVKSKGACKMSFEENSDGEVEVVIYTSDSEITLYSAAGNVGANTNRRVIATLNKKVKVTIGYKTESDFAITGTNVADITFNRSMGGIETSCRSDGNDDVPISITVTNGSKTKTIKLATYTGVITY
ncbi:MAG: prepilin-type N-terminal cleavage/methylation domain-containing protein [Lachnospiraceae bacterium]|nr:prepilin-type N-terminal cleavage/methylation domain-containing protein [Lachnospiraceae bacterium]